MQICGLRMLRSVTRPRISTSTSSGTSPSDQKTFCYVFTGEIHRSPPYHVPGGKLAVVIFYSGSKKTSDLREEAKIIMLRMGLNIRVSQSNQ